MPQHGDSKKNPAPHHLYEILDKETDDLFKYGISAGELGKDGLSLRIRLQLEHDNLVAGYERFFVKILLTNIPGREKALELEDWYIEAYRKIHGKSPPGNKGKKRRHH